MTGLLSATGPRTVTGIWAAAGLAGRFHHARAHRFFSHARWNPDTLGLLLARLVVARFVPPRAALTIVFWQHDGPGKGSAAPADPQSVTAEQCEPLRILVRS
ncbi:transposase [Amycolatopsis sp. H20-H5]|uniref:transposase n=1 Tax=Amycolatopsis sp. H20-H5 TaxID=3046309 RepID=UPI003FA3D9D0